MTDAIIVICTRLESSRVPKKVFRKIAGRTVIDHILHRIIPSGLQTVIAVPYGQEAEYRKRLQSWGEQLKFFAGNPESPLHRTADVLTIGRDIREPMPKWVVRITHDDPIIDTDTMLELLERCEKEDVKTGDIGYGCSPGIIQGAGVEVIRSENIVYAANKRKEPTEFLTYFVRGEGLPRPGIFRMEPEPMKSGDSRLTLDYPEDVLLLEVVLRRLGGDATTEQIVDFLNRNPSLLNINHLPELSIYTCAKDAEKFVHQCIDSAKWLRGVDSEYVFVDDYSQDGTLEIACSMAGKVFTNEENIGLASSCNIALSKCKGKYVMRLDADDRLDRSFPSHYPAVRKLLEDGANVVYPAYFLMDENGGKLNQVIGGAVNSHAGCAIFDKKFLDELRFKEGLRHWDGEELYRRIVDAGGKIAYYPNPTWLYRQHKDSMSKNDLEERRRVREEIEG